MAATTVHETYKLDRSRSRLAKFVIDLFSSSLGRRDAPFRAVPGIA
jgi:hypothetical protein